jgi:type I restriction enzyme R subunit
MVRNGFIKLTELNRSVNEVLIESDLKAALIALNLEISMRNELADEVIL